MFPCRVSSASTMSCLRSAWTYHMPSPSWRPLWTSATRSQSSPNSWGMPVPPGQLINKPFYYTAECIYIIINYILSLYEHVSQTVFLHQRTEAFCQWRRWRSDQELREMFKSLNPVSAPACFSKNKHGGRVKFPYTFPDDVCITQTSVDVRWKYIDQCPGHVKFILLIAVFFCFFLKKKILKYSLFQG